MSGREKGETIGLGTAGSSTRVANQREKQTATMKRMAMSLHCPWPLTDLTIIRLEKHCGGRGGGHRRYTRTP